MLDSFLYLSILEYTKLTLNNIHHLTISLQDVDKLCCFAVPNENVPRVTPADDIFVLQAEIVHILDCLDVAMAGVDTCMGYTRDVALDSPSPVTTAAEV